MSYRSRYAFDTAQSKYDNMSPDDEKEDEEEKDSEDDFDFESWEDYCHEQEIEADSQRYLNWLYNTK